MGNNLKFWKKYIKEKLEKKNKLSNGPMNFVAFVSVHSKQKIVIYVINVF